METYDDIGVVASFVPEDEHVVRDAPVLSGSALVGRLRQGFPIEEFHALRDLLQIPEESLGRYIGMSAATLHRRKKSKALTSAESERVVRFARLFGLSVEVLESEEGAREWLKTPNPGTAGETPLSFADTEFGAREVENLLGRLDHGVFS